MGSTILVADSFSFDEAGVFGRAFANQRVLYAILASEGVDKALVLGDTSHFASLPGTLRDKLSPLRSASELERALSSKEVGAIFCSDFVNRYADWIFLRNEKGSAAPVFGLTHSLSYQRFTESIFRSLTAGACPQDAVLCTTTSAKAVMEQLFSQVEPTLRLPGKRPDLYLFPLPLEAETEETWLGQKPEIPFQALYLGRIDWQTKADLLPLASVVDKMPSTCKLVIAGAVDNPNYDRLVRHMLGNKGVEILGCVDEQKKRELLAKSHVLISPVDNYQETFGLSVIEAMAYGCVPIVSDFDGYRDLLEDGKSGFLIKTLGAPLPKEMRVMQSLVSENIYHGWWAAGLSWQPQDVLNRLSLLCSNRKLWKEMSRGAVERSRHFQIKECSRRVEALLKRRLEETPKSPYYPFCWNVEEVFSEYPTSWWGDQTVALTQTGTAYLNEPRPIPQLALLSGFYDDRHIRNLLLWIQNGKNIGECLGMGAQLILFSLLLKNQLIELKEQDSEPKT
ncbi:MAG: glycosyltransferase family 4 protein [Proteobacteria bacterium]|nr:glycosyltransferase family 4 protein [Pseudomonadota bacterium]